MTPHVGNSIVCWSTCSAQHKKYHNLLHWSFVRGNHRWLGVSLQGPSKCSMSWRQNDKFHYCDVIMVAMVSQIISLTIVYSIVHSGADQRKDQSSASLAFVRRVHRGPVNSPHKWPVTRKMFPFHDVIMSTNYPFSTCINNHYNLCEDRATADDIYWYPIRKCVTVAWRNDWVPV